MISVTSIPSPYIIYGLVDPRTDSLRYVGKSTSGLTRPKKHLFPSVLQREAQTRRVKWIKSLLQEGVRPNIVVLQIADSSEDLGLLEKKAIARYRSMGVDLVNGTDGGEGTVGYHHRPESKEKMSAARKGKPGHPHTEEHKQYMRNLYLGKPRSDETKQKVREACLGRVQSQETIDKQRKSRQGHFNSVEWRIWRSRQCGGRPIIEVQSGIRYESVSEAARALNLNPGNIANVLSGRCKNTGGHAFVYAEGSP